MDFPVKEKYNQFYKSIGFEREGLFDLIKKEFKPETVIYPGCSIHLTPSFYFSHVIYVDKSELAGFFFNNVPLVNELINQNKTYKQSAYWSYLKKDFQLDLNLKRHSYDFLISLFSGKLIEYCSKYLRVGGIVLTNSLFSDNENINCSSDYQLQALIKCKNLKYSIDYSLQVGKLAKSELRPESTGYKYIDKEVYFIYKKLGKKVKPSRSKT